MKNFPDGEGRIKTGGQATRKGNAMTTFRFILLFILVLTPAYTTGGVTSLHDAVNTNNAAVVKVLLEQGADVNATNEDGHTALHIAAIRNRAGVAKVLLEHGADVNATVGNGWTALEIAADKGYTDVIKVLLEHGAHVGTP